MKVFYIIPPNYQFTGHPGNFKIKLYLFQERLSLRYKIILKLLPVFKRAFLKSKILYFTFFIIDYSVYDQLLPHLK